MHCQILAASAKLPTWCQEACHEFEKRLTRFLPCTLTEIPIARRHKSGLIAHYQQAEAKKMLQYPAAYDLVIALAIKGALWSTETLAHHLHQWKQNYEKVFFLIGGPDGLHSTCLQRANIHWSLSPLTFPYALTRVLLLEQLYRASSLLAHHPYHN